MSEFYPNNPRNNKGKPVANQEQPKITQIPGLPLAEVIGINEYFVTTIDEDNERNTLLGPSSLSEHGAITAWNNLIATIQAPAIANLQAENERLREALRRSDRHLANAQYEDEARHKDEFISYARHSIDEALKQESHPNDR